MNDAATFHGSSGPPIVFSGGRGDLAGIAIVNALLMVITFSIYRFWARTRIRRFYWQNIELGGDPLEYTGRGMELFLGFLIVVAIFIPISLGVGTVQTLLQLQAPDFAGLVNLLLFVVIWWLIGYAVFRARRYRLTRTLWRGIRFGQDGSPARYAWIRFGWTLLVVITLGAAVPWSHVALRRYEMTNTRFGFSHFDYAGRGRDLFRYWWPALLALLVGIAAVALIGYESVTIAQSIDAMNNPDADAVFFQTLLSSNLGAAAITMLIVAGIGYFLLGARYRVASLRYLFAVSELEGVTFRSMARTGRILIYALVALAIFIVTVAIVVAFVAMIIGQGGMGPAPFLHNLATIAVIIIGLLFVGIIRQVFFEFPLIRHVVTTLETSDMSALDSVVQSTRDDPRFGEGLLDALDVDTDVV